MEVVKGGEKQEVKKETPEEACGRRFSVTFVPRKANVLVDVIDVKKADKKVILLEGSDKPEDYYYEHPFQGIIVALGPDCGKMPLGNTGHTSANDLSAGDRVAFRNISGHPIRDKGKTYFLLADHDIIGILGKV